ncbi:hypothetical protein [Methanolobus profundi]|nr:hypothetical protein [Methanolobus profundi]
MVSKTVDIGRELFEWIGMPQANGTNNSGRMAGPDLIEYHYQIICNR